MLVPELVGRVRVREGPYFADSGDFPDAGSARLGIVLGPWSGVELFANAGQGFDSNDARGVETTVDPSSGAAVEPADPLARTDGAELGARGVFGELHSSLALGLLDSEDEVVFENDAGATLPNREARRHGFEHANDRQLAPSWTLALDAARSRARLLDGASNTEHAPGAPETGHSLTLTWLPRENAFAALRARHFGPRDLTTDGRERSSESTLVHLQAGWRIDSRWTVELDLSNLLDEDANESEAFYSSQLAGEPTPVADTHFHPTEGRTLRARIAASW
jgi:outer membrane receptor protein involved in Fe transport